MLLFLAHHDIVYCVNAAYVCYHCWLIYLLSDETLLIGRRKGRSTGI